MPTPLPPTGDHASALLPSRAALSALLDGADEALLLFDDLGHLSFCNRAAMRQLRAEPGQGAASLAAVLGSSATTWLDECLRSPQAGLRSLRVRLDDGRAALLSAWRVARDLALRLQFEAARSPELSAEGSSEDSPEHALEHASAHAPERAAALPLPPGATLDMLHMLWASPFPATLQDAGFRLVAVNDAYLGFSGRTREALLGTDPLLLQPEEDRSTQIESRSELPQRLAGRAVPLLGEQRLLDAHGRERWSRVSGYQVSDDQGQPLLLCVLQDSTAEHVARAQADRSLDELAQWFDLSPTGMLVFDEAGLIVRSNPAFEALIGQVPVLLSDASPELQALLAWADGAPRKALQPAAPPLESHVSLPLPDGRRQRLSARVRGFATDQGLHRYMAVVEDRSAEEERDLAQLEIGALMDTAGVGVATFDSARGWLRPRAERRRAPAKSAGLQSIARDIVVPESLPEYERLQQALRLGERAEVRYEVMHAELGRRWLLTRVDPGEADTGRRTVVTVDVTEQESAQRQSQQWLRELTTILDGTTAGIAYLRGALLVRCNRRFEAMLGLPAGAAAGATTQELFGRFPQAMSALATQPSFECELDVPDAQGMSAWYSLSVRHAEAAPGEFEAVAVLTDISRLKSQQAELEALLRDRELMFSLSDVGIAYLRGGRIERANQALAALTGYVESELAALDPAELAPSSDAHHKHQAEEQQALRQSGRFHGERQLRRRDGSLLWVQVAQRLVDEGDESAGRICSFVDVDERHRARQSMQLQAERTRAILDSVLVGIVTVGDGGIEWMNRSARRMFAGELADFVGEPISTVATPEPGHPLRQTHYLHTLTEGRAQTFECRLKARDGREFWVVGNAVVTARESTGRQITFALLDIDRRRKAELDSAQAQASLQRIIATAPLAIALFDGRTQRVLQHNQMAAAFFGRPMLHWVGSTLRERSGGEPATAISADLGAALQSTEVLRREMRLDGPKGVRVWDVRFVSLPSSAGAAEQVLLVASDVTEQRAEAEQRFAAALSQREMLVKEVHHRIKNNLQGVAGLLQQNAARHPELAVILSESVGQVQAIAQVYGLQVGAGGPLRLGSVVEAIALSVQRTFGRTVLVEPYTAEVATFLLPEAEAIPIALTINELMTNAVKHSVQADVRCALSCRDDEVQLQIRNAGQLREGFSLTQFPGGVSGLGLVRALLPRRSASFDLRQDSDEVLAEVVLKVPSVVRESG